MGPTQDLKNGPPIPHHALSGLNMGPFGHLFAWAPPQLQALRSYSYAIKYTLSWVKRTTTFDPKRWMCGILYLHIPQSTVLVSMKKRELMKRKYCLKTKYCLNLLTIPSEDDSGDDEVESREHMLRLFLASKKHAGIHPSRSLALTPLTNHHPPSPTDTSCTSSPEFSVISSGFVAT